MTRCTCLIPKPVDSHVMTCKTCGGEIHEPCMYKSVNGPCCNGGAVKIGYYYYCTEHAKAAEAK